MQTDVADLDAIQGDVSCSSLDDPEESQRQRRLAGAGAAHDANLLPSGDVGVDALQDQVEAGPVAGLVVVELDPARLRPGGRRPRLALIHPDGLLRRLRVLLDPLHGHDVGFDFGGHADEPAELLGHAHSVADGHADKADLDGVTREDAEDGGEEDDDRCDHVQTG